VVAADDSRQVRNRFSRRLCNDLKNQRREYGEGQNRTAEREFSPFAAPGVTCDFFVDYHQGIFGKSRVHYPAFRRKERATMGMNRLSFALEAAC
jgi:hypothetical protein